jgi:hypothetical protein
MLPLTNSGSGVCNSTMTGQAASRAILSISPSACSEFAPSPTSATSGRSRGGHRPTSSASISRAIYLMAQSDDNRGEDRKTILALVCDQDA